jgi:hypothetical protein
MGHSILELAFSQDTRRAKVAALFARKSEDVSPIFSWGFFVSWGDPTRNDGVWGIHV